MTVVLIVYRWRIKLDERNILFEVRWSLLLIQSQMFNSYNIFWLQRTMNLWNKQFGLWYIYAVFYKYIQHGLDWKSLKESQMKTSLKCTWIDRDSFHNSLIILIILVKVFSEFHMMSSSSSGRLCKTQAQGSLSRLSFCWTCVPC